MRWELSHRGKEVQVQAQSFSEIAGDGDPLEDIKRRRDVFLALHTEIIFPLLPEGHLDLEARGGKRAQPYKLVQQPIG